MKNSIFVFLSKAILAAAVLGGIPAKALSQEKTAFPFSRYSYNPEEAAMAGAVGVRTSTIGNAGFSNAAAAVFSEERFKAAAAFRRFSPDKLKESFYSIGAAYKPSDRTVLGIGAVYGANEKYDKYNDLGSRYGSYRPKDMLFSAGAAYRFAEYLSAGVNVRYAGSSIAEGHSYDAVSLDAMAMTRFSPGAQLTLKAAGGISSVGGKIKSYNGSKVSLPSSAVVAVGADYAPGALHKVEAELDADCYFEDGPAFSAGASYCYAGMASIRAGYRYGGDTVVPSHVSAGAGFRYAGVQIDFAYLIPAGKDSSLLKKTFTLGLAWSF